MTGDQTASLALFGGTPVRATLLPYGWQSIDEDDIQAVVDVLRSPWLTTGPKVSEFEEAFAAYVGGAHAVSFSSGTAALHAAAYAAGLNAGDEAITTPLTFCATANCVVYVAATVVFADVCSDTLNLDPDEVARRITPRTRAILPVDYAGHPAALDPLLELADHHGLVLIEDGCHALGAGYRGRKIGSISTMTVFSFHPVKHITTGEGGMVTTDDPGLARRLRRFRSHCISDDHHARSSGASWSYDIGELGFNYRLTDFQCALGLSQLAKLGAWLARRRQIAARYRDRLQSLAELELPVVLAEHDPAWHLYVIRLRLERLRGTREEVFRALRAENIGVNVHYIPVPWHSFYRKLGYRPGHWPVAEAAYERILTLPIFAAMTDDDVDSVVTAVEKVIAHFRR